MKRVPEKFELDEYDIREAISMWLDNEIADGVEHEYTISFKTEERDERPKKGFVGGSMNDYRVTVITAIAEKD